MVTSPSCLTVHPEARFLRALIERIRKGYCVLLLGPGVAIAPDDPETPLTTRLASELANDNQIADNPRLKDPTDLRHVAEVYYQIKRDKYELADAAQTFYRRFGGVTTDIHRCLAALPFKLCISTTPDDLLYNAFKEHKKEPKRAHYNPSQPQGEVQAEPTEKEPLIYHLYGHYSDGDSLVLTEKDLIEFLVNVTQNTPPLPDVIKGHMADKKTSFLFIGFGFHHWHVRVLLQVLQVFGHKDRSVAVENTAFFGSPEHALTIVFFGDYAIEIKAFSCEEFARELLKIYETQPCPETVAVAAPPPDAPKVFICYAGEDAESVERLEERLYEAGIAVWRDKSDMMIGDKWGPELQHVIETKVDYFIAAQSTAWDRAIEGYFFKEVLCAQERQKGMPPEQRFLLPIKLDRCEGLEQLKHVYHQCEIHEATGFDELVSTIRDDWRKRQERTHKAVQVRSAAPSV